MTPSFPKSLEFKNHLELDKKLKYLTVKNYMSQVNKYFKTYGAISSENVSVFFADSPNPNRIKAMQTYLRFLQKEGEDVSAILDIALSIKSKPTDRKAMSTLDLEKGKDFIKHLLENDNKEVAVICMIIYDAGVRIRALLKHRKKDVDVYPDGTIYFNFQEKQGKFTRRMVTPETFEHFKMLTCLADCKPETFLFFNRQAVTDEEIDKKYYGLWETIRKESKIFFGDEKVSFHWLRRGAAVQIYKESGNDIMAASKFIGDTVQQAEKYLKIQAQRSEEIIRKTKREW